MELLHLGCQIWGLAALVLQTVAGPIIWAPALHMEGQLGIPGSWLWPGQDKTTVAV